jgi:hypothetical protein
MQLIVMPDYFIALVTQYCGAMNEDQAARYAKSVVDAWYFTLPKEKQDALIKLLPDYLRPKKQLFLFSRKQNNSIDQSKIFISRLMIDLSKSSPDEAEYIASGIMKSLKVISSPEKKFALSKLFDDKLLELYIQA